MPFEEIRHTADYSIRVWARDMPSLFSEAARGMNSLSGMQLDETHQFNQEILLNAIDNECLLIAFLSELIFVAEQEQVGFDIFKINLGKISLHATLQGARIISIGKAIKAVTFHNLKIIRTGEFLEAVLVFDV